MSDTVQITTLRRALLAENIAPGLDQWAVAEALLSRVIEAIDGRDAYVASHGLDPAFALPDANWRDHPDNDFALTVAEIRKLRRDDLRHLRLLSGVFSGYSLRTFSIPAGHRSYAVIPPDFDASWADVDPSDEIERYGHETRDVRAIYRPPNALGEVGWWLGDVILNRDTRIYQERLTLLERAGEIDRLRTLRAPRILEIGGGYGALAEALLQAIPQARYTICDLPEALLFSGAWLTLAGRRACSLWPQTGHVTLVPNYRFHELAGPFDLVINTLSMSEMSAHQVHTYCRGVSGLIGSSGAFFEQNQDNRHIGLQWAPELIAEHFPNRTRLAPDHHHLSGKAHLWRN